MRLSILGWRTACVITLISEKKSFSCTETELHEYRSHVLGTEIHSQTGKKKNLTFLASKLIQRSIDVMDHARIHHTQTIKEFLQEQNVFTKFLSLHLPDLAKQSKNVFIYLTISPWKFLLTALVDGLSVGTDWVTAHLLKFPGLSSVSWPLVTFLSFRLSRLVLRFPTLSALLPSFWESFRSHQL